MLKDRSGFPRHDVLGDLAERVVAGARTKPQRGAHPRDQDEVLAQTAKWVTTAPPQDPLEATWDLSAPPAELDLILPAERAVRLHIQGPAQALFSAARLHLRGRPLVRNLADPGWGSLRADGVSANDPSRPTTGFQLPRPEPIAALGARLRQGSASHRIDVLGPSTSGGLPLARIKLTAPGGVSDVALEQAGLQFVHITEQAALDDFDYLIRSGSFSRRLAIGIAGGPPIQVLQTALKGGTEAQSMALAGPLNQAWSKIDGDRGEAVIDLLSPTDCRLGLTLEADWAEHIPGIRGPADDALAAETRLVLDPVTPVRLTLPTIAAATSPDSKAQAKRQVLLHLRGRIEPARFHHLLDPMAAPALSVQVDEGHEVAQPIRLHASGDDPPGDCIALWLWLDQPPTEPMTLRLRLHAPDAEGLPDEASPIERSLKLPADPTAYRPSAGGFAHRAVLDQPAPLPALADPGWLLLSLLGDRTPVWLQHDRLAARATPPLTEPDGIGRGAAGYRNLASTSAWQVRRFSRAHTALRLALETASDIATEGDGLITLNQASLPGIAGIGAGIDALVEMPIDQDTIELISSARGTLHIRAQSIGRRG